MSDEKRNDVWDKDFLKKKLNPELVRGYMVAPWWFTNPDSIYQLKHDAHTLYAARRDVYPETL